MQRERGKNGGKQRQRPQERRKKDRGGQATMTPALSKPGYLHTGCPAPMSFSNELTVPLFIYFKVTQNLTGYKGSIETESRLMTAKGGWGGMGSGGLMDMGCPLEVRKSFWN